MNDPVVAGGLINAALYLFSVMFAAVCAGNHEATLLAIASMGVAAISYGCEMVEKPPRWASAATSLLSWILGIAAGSSLVMGYFL